MKHAMIFILPALVFIASCGDTSVTRTLPNVTGKTGDVLVVMDKQMWDGSPGQAVREQVSPMLISLP